MATGLNLLPKPPYPSASGQDAVEAAIAYDAAGQDYFTYADGRADALFEFTGHYNYADRLVWQQIETALLALKAQGRQQIRILDAGCGPGTWLIRAATRAYELGFDRVEAAGFDISPEMIRLARANAGSRSGYCFQTGDLMAPIEEEAGSVDLTLCLYGVINHLPRESHARVAAELSRVCSGYLFVTARAVGSLPTIFVSSLESARSFSQDNRNDRFEVGLVNGTCLSFTAHLFTGAELKALFAPHVAEAGLMGLDVFHSRFAPDGRWNPDSLPYASLFEQELCKLEERCAVDPVFMDRAAHILVRADCSR